MGPNNESWQPAGYEAIDGSPETAWGFTDPGADGWIRVGIAGNQNLKEIRILPGQNESPGSFYEYGRPKTVDVIRSDGTFTTISLEDEPALQKFANSGTGEWVQVYVKDIYHGTKNNDTYISEIDFGTEPAPYFEEVVPLTAGQGLSTTLAPSTTQPSIGMSSVTTQAPGTTTATGGLPTTIAVAKEGGGSLVWPAYVATAVAAIALATAVVLFVRLRARES